MSVRSFLEAIDQLLTPIQQAETAIKEDNADELRKILLKHALTEESYVNPQAKENLLHFAVRQDAANCVSILCKPPYSWSPDRPNVSDRSPLQICESRAYLPVWYPLVMYSYMNEPATPLPGFDQTPPRSVSALLIYPHVFAKNPMDINNEIFKAGYRIGPSVDLRLQALTSANLALLFELYMASPELVKFDPPLRTGPRMLVDKLCCSATCDYPECLVQDFRQQPNATDVFFACFNHWSFHQLQSIVDGHKITCPPRLVEFCRRRIRRSVTLAMIFRSRMIGPESTKGLNYPRVISNLPLPPIIHTFLAYRDIWPAFPRHGIPRRSNLHWLRIQQAFEMLLPEPDLDRLDE